MNSYNRSPCRSILQHVCFIPQTAQGNNISCQIHRCLISLEATHPSPTRCPSPQLLQAVTFWSPIVGDHVEKTLEFRSRFSPSQRKSPAELPSLIKKPIGIPPGDHVKENEAQLPIYSTLVILPHFDLEESEELVGICQWFTSTYHPWDWYNLTAGMAWMIDFS